MTREMFDSLFGRGKSTPRPRAVAEESGGIERNRFRSNEEIYLSLFTDGYVLLPNMVEKPLVDKALRAINSSLGRNVPNRQDMCPDVANTPAISDLYNKTPVKGLIDQLLQENTSVTGGQIAIRFPGDNTAGDDFEVPQNWENHWHIDGLGDHNVKGKQSFFGDIRNFTALVGVVLQDATEEYMGNLAVYPGSHSELQQHFRQNGFDDLYSRGVAGLPRLAMQRGVKQITAKAGDVVILNYCLAHNVAPNTSPQLRYNVYFRITSSLHRRKKKIDGSKNSATDISMAAMHHYPDAMLDVWHDWSGLRSNLPPRALPEAHVCGNDDENHSEILYEDEEQRQLDLALQRSLHDR